MVEPFYIILKKILGSDVFQNAQLLDVGCARFKESVAMRDLGAKITAIDKCEREATPENIRFFLSDFLTFQPDQEFDIVYLSNVALFMPTHDVFAKMQALNPKIIAVRTMYHYPNPNWDHKELQKLYFTKPENWTGFFEPLGYSTTLSKQYEKDTPDMRGRLRNFRYTEYIGIKTK